MLNHLQKYDSYECFLKTDSQQLMHALHINNSERCVVINQIKKAALPLPIDVLDLINASHQLEMLEEDTDNWYIITSKIDGVPIFQPTENPDAIPHGIITKHLSEFIALIHDYDHLAPYYQYHLLESSQFVLCHNQLKSKEVIILSVLTEGFIDFNAVRALAIQRLSELIALLGVTERETYETVNWVPILEASASVNSLSALSQLWTTEIEVIKSRLKSTPLTNLYTLKAAESSDPLAIRRLNDLDKKKELESLQPPEPRPPYKMNPAIVLTLILVLSFLAVLFFPGLLDQLMGRKSQAAEAPPNSQETTSSQVAELPAENLLGISNDPAEKLAFSLISFAEGNWQFDKNQFYSGDQSLRLMLDAQSPNGAILLNPISLSKNTSFSLWMMSDKTLETKIQLAFYKGLEVVQVIDKTISLEAPMTWYLINPLENISYHDLSNSNTLKITFNGDAQTLWLDDLSLESYK